VELDERLELILALADGIAEKEDEIIETAVKDIGFTYKDVANELEITLERLRMFKKAVGLLESRKPICGRGEEVALILPYNGSAWLNIAIASIFLAGNNVRVKFSSRDAAIAEVKKKFIFEGPGNDPFVVLNDADAERAVEDLVSSKYMYSGQACIAPERVYVQGEVYDDFLKEFVEQTKSLVVGKPENPETDIAPLASRKAVESYTFGNFGTVSVNEPRAESWKGALVTKPIGGYGYSGWVWDFDDGFKLKQGPKLFSLETSFECRELRGNTVG